MVSLFPMLFLETLAMAWKLRETTSLQEEEECELAPCHPEAGTVLPRTEVRFAHTVKPGLKRRRKGERRGTWLWRGGHCPPLQLENQSRRSCEVAMLDAKVKSDQLAFSSLFPKALDLSVQGSQFTSQTCMGQGRGWGRCDHAISWCWIRVLRSPAERSTGV